MTWLLFPVVGALIGWLTNLVAIWLLFRPREPVSLYGLQIQGLLPRRQRDLAIILGEIVETELLSKDRIAAALSQPALQEELIWTATGAAERAVVARMPSFLPRGVTGFITNYIKEAMAREMRSFTATQLPALFARWVDKIDIAGQVRERIEALDLTELESLTFKLARRELKHIEWFGGILGFLVGLAQAALYHILN